MSSYDLVKKLKGNITMCAGWKGTLQSTTMAEVFLNCSQINSFAKGMMRLNEVILVNV